MLIRKHNENKVLAFEVSLEGQVGLIRQRWRSRVLKKREFCKWGCTGG
jgi:hypothetical protein